MPQRVPGQLGAPVDHEDGRRGRSSFPLPLAPGRRVVGALVILALTGLAATGCTQQAGRDGTPTAPSAPGTDLASHRRSPTLSQVRIEPLTTTPGGGRKRFKFTGVVTDADNDVVGGRIRLNLRDLRQVIAAIIRQKAPTEQTAEESTTAAATPAAGFESATINRTQLEAVFFLRQAPKKALRTTATVEDVAKNRSNEVATSVPPVPPPTSPEPKPPSPEPRPPDPAPKPPDSEPRDDGTKPVDDGTRPVDDGGTKPQR